MATLKDIARECGVSTMTVSAVLNNKPGEASAPLRERVLEVARRLRYHPNAAARRLAGKGINTIGVADRATDPTYWSSPYQSPILEGILAAARRHGRDILYFAGHPSHDIATSLPVYSDGRCDGLIHFAPDLHDDAIAQIGDSGLPVVLIGDSRPYARISSVDVDNVGAVMEAVGYLIALGHRRIGMLMGNDAAFANEQRVEGFRRAHEDAGLCVDESLLLPGPAWELSGEERARALLSGPPQTHPTAIFCFNDVLALGTLRAAASLGIPVPDRLSVIGFDDIAPASMISPALTTIRQPLRQIGERALELLLDVISGTRPPGTVEILPHEFVVRASTGTPYSGGR